MKTLRGRFNRGLPPEKALTPEPALPHGKFTTLDGNTLNIKQWAEFYGINYQWLWQQLKKRPLAEAVKRWKARLDGKQYTVNGETLTRTEWAKRIGITLKGLEYRLERMSPEDAVTIPRRAFSNRGGRKAKLYLFDGQTLSINQWASKLGLTALWLRIDSRECL